jgi:Abortive infection C-terminus
LADFKEKYSLTEKQVQCGHCSVKAFMRIICEGEDSFFIGNDQCGYDDVNHKWQVLKCLACSEINVLQYSSSSLWDYDIGDETFSSGVWTTVLHPSFNKEKPLDLRISSQVIELAISDVEALIPTSGSISGIDRIHTAFHGYLRLVCVHAGVPFSNDDGVTKLFKTLCQYHPKLQSDNPNSQATDRLLKSFAGIIDSLNPIRNHASVAHPNEHLLEKEEAMLFIDVVRTLLRYLNEKLRV